MSVVVANENVTLEQVSTEINESPIDEISQDSLQATDMDKVLSKEASGNTWQNLKEDISSLKDGDTLYLNGNNYSQDSDTIQINKNIVIVGGSSLDDNSFATIDACGKYQIFQIKSTVTLIGINFINGHANDDGGAIKVIDAKLTVINCSFKNNSAEGFVNGGGAIYSIGEPISIINCSFIGNSAYYDGGAVACSGKISVIGCSFVNNSDRTRGGAIDCSRGGSFVNCSFIGNSASSSGGVIHVGFDRSYFVNCSFVNNSAGGDAGVIYYGQDGFIIVNCSFISNSAGGDAGAIYFMGLGSSVVNCSFVNNSAGSMDRGGAILCFDEKFSVINCSFVGNSANLGGAINSFKNIYIENCSFVANSAGGDAGAIYYFSSGSSVNCSFVNNSAGNGGAIRCFDKKISLINCSFVGNSANNGSAIYVLYEMSISNSVFLDNKALINSIVLTGSLKDYPLVNVTLNASYLGNDNLLNAIYLTNSFEGNTYYPSVKLLNVSYWGHEGVMNTGDSEINVVMDSGLLSAGPDSSDIVVSNLEAGQNITLDLFKDGLHFKKFILVTNSNGEVNVNLYGLPGGEYRVKAYNPENNYYTTTESNEFVFTIDKIPTIIEASSVNITVGQVETLRFNISHQFSDSELINKSSGNVSLVINGKTYVGNVKDDVAEINITDLKSGKYEIEVVYSGDDRFASSNTKTTFSVLKIKDYTMDIKTEVNGNNVKITVSLPKDSTGNVTIRIGEKNYTVPINEGKAILNLRNLNSGEFNVLAYYPGDDKYDKNMNQTNIMIKEVEKNQTEDKPHIDINKTVDKVDNKENSILKEILKDKTATGNPIALIILSLLSLVLLRKFKF